MPKRTLKELSSRARAALQEAETRLRGPVVYEWAWDMVFTEAERRQLGGDLTLCHDKHLVQLYVTLREVLQFRAVIDLAHGVGFLTEAHRAWLLRATGEGDAAGRAESQPSLPFETPVWNKQTHTLTLAGELIRQVKRPGAAANIIRILDAFHENDWPFRIDDPLVGGQDPQRLAAALRSLNNGLRRIKFRKDGSGKGVFWQLS